MKQIYLSILSLLFIAGIAQASELTKLASSNELFSLQTLRTTVQKHPVKTIAILAAVAGTVWGLKKIVPPLLHARMINRIRGTIIRPDENTIEVTFLKTDPDGVRKAWRDSLTHELQQKISERSDSFSWEVVQEPVLYPNTPTIGSRFSIRRKAEYDLHK